MSEFKLHKKNLDMEDFNLSKLIYNASEFPKSTEVIGTEWIKEFIKRCEELSVYANHKSDTKQLAWGDMAIRIEDLKLLVGSQLI